MLQGIEENLALLSQLYGPAWSMRVYYTLDDLDHSTTMAFLCRLHQSTFIISLQIGLHQPCIGPLSSLKPAWKPKGGSHPNVSQVRVEALWPSGDILGIKF